MPEVSKPVSNILANVAESRPVFEIVPYSLTHYSLYSVYDIVHYIGNEQHYAEHFSIDVICVSKCAGYLCEADRCPNHVNKPGTREESWRLY